MAPVLITLVMEAALLVQELRLTNVLLVLSVNNFSLMAHAVLATVLATPVLVEP